MGLNDTPNSERVHIGIFGRRNAGKSSIINALTGQDLAIVSDIKGTTTDPVSKAMELLPLGPVVMIDTPGLDDTGPLGAMRIHKSYQVLNKTDIALLVIDGTVGMIPEEQVFVEKLQEKNLPYIIVMNKADLIPQRPPLPDAPQAPTIWVSAASGENVETLKELIAVSVPNSDDKRRLIGDLINAGDFVVLVVPIDKSAPKGRLILPQQQTIRDILESDATAVVIKEHALRDTLTRLNPKPRLVVTDSQVFAQVAVATPEDIFLTSFSILFARYKGNLEEMVGGVRALETLQDGDGILVAEGCTHHRQCEDIGTVKIPQWIGQHTQKKPIYTFCSGTTFPDDLSPYRLIVHCGGCTLNEREMHYRLRCAQDQGTPMTNYGILIAYMQGILKRSLSVFPQISALLE